MQQQARVISLLRFGRTIISSSARAYSSTINSTIDVSSLRQSSYWKGKFRKLCEFRDTNKDGFLNRADFILMINKYGENTRNSKLVDLFSKNMLELCDNFGLEHESINLTYDEFEEKWLAALESDTKKHQNIFKVMFICLDVNGDGLISMDEWKAHSEAIAGVPPEQAEAMFLSMDTNGDGKIDEDEFNAFHFEFFYGTENKSKNFY